MKDLIKSIEKMYVNIHNKDQHSQGISILLTENQLKQSIMMIKKTVNHWIESGYIKSNSKDGIKRYLGVLHKISRWIDAESAMIDVFYGNVLLPEYILLTIHRIPDVSAIMYAIINEVKIRKRMSSLIEGVPEEAEC